MRAAPAVSVTGSGGLPWRLTQSLLPALAASALAAWLSLRAEMPAAWATGVFVATAVAVLLPAWRLARPHRFELRFDGLQWHLDGSAGEVELLMDLGIFLLLRWRSPGQGRGQHLALTAREAGSSLHGLRIALYAWRQASGADAASAAPPAGR